MGSEGGIALDNVKRCSMWSTEMQLIDFPVSNAGVWDSHGREDASPEVDFTNVHFKATVCRLYFNIKKLKRRFIVQQNAIRYFLRQCTGTAHRVLEVYSNGESTKALQ